MSSVRSPRTMSGRMPSVMRFRSSGGEPPLPQRAGDDAEHRAAIEAKEPVGQGDELEVAQACGGQIAWRCQEGRQARPLVAACFSSTSTP